MRFVEFKRSSGKVFYINVRDIRTGLNLFSSLSPVIRLCLGVYIRLMSNFKWYLRELPSHIQDIERLIIYQQSDDLFCSYYVSTDNKKVVVLFEDGNETRIFKVACDESCNELIEKEIDILREYSDSTIFPQIISEGYFSSFRYAQIEFFVDSRNSYQLPEAMKDINGEYDTCFVTHEYIKTRLLNTLEYLPSTVQRFSKEDLIKLVCQDEFIALNRGFEHGDMAPWNVLITAKGTKLIDFEFSRRDGLPDLDYLAFEFKYRYSIKNENLENIFSDMLKRYSISLLGLFVLDSGSKGILNEKEIFFGLNFLLDEDNSR